jgi:hypothetical protein
MPDPADKMKVGTNCVSRGRHCPFCASSPRTGTAMLEAPIILCEGLPTGGGSSLPSLPEGCVERQEESGLGAANCGACSEKTSRPSCEVALGATTIYCEVSGLCCDPVCMKLGFNDRLHK